MLRRRVCNRRNRMTRAGYLVGRFHALVIVAGLAAPAAAQEQWTLITADFRAAPVGLKSIGPDGLRVTDNVGNAERLVTLDEFLQVERPLPGSAQQGKFVLHLAGGDRLAGEPLALEGEQLVWRNGAAGELRVPMNRLLAMTRPAQSPPERRPSDDVITLANGDAVRGIIAAVGGGKVSVQRTDAAEPLPVPIDSIVSIQFAATAGPNVADARGYRLRLGDGSSLAATALTLAAGKLSVDLGDGKPRPLDLSKVAGIEQVNGPAAWLSARTPSEKLYVPFFGNGQEYPARMDAMVDGGRDLRFGGKTFRRAIGVHAFSRLTWPLDGKYAAFRTQYAVDERLSQADMTVRIKLDDKVVHEKQSVRAGTLSPVIVIDLSSAKALTLEVDFGAGTDVQDRLVWLEPALLKKKPAEEPPTPPAEPAPTPAP